MAAAQVEDEAFVTLATTDAYCLGALVLGHSLRNVGTTRKLVVMISPQVSGSIRSQLSGVFDLVKDVDVLDSRDVSNLALLSRPDLGVTFTKFHCWRLTDFSKCVFLDADTLVLQNCDELFEREELSAAPDAGWPDCFNSGVFVYKPSDETYQSLLSFAISQGSFDGGDQGLLNEFFKDWSTKDISKHLPFTFNVVSQAFYSYLPAFKQYGKNIKICHFIGEKKPWHYSIDPVTGDVMTDSTTVHNQTFLQIWWKYFLSLVHPFLDPTLISPQHLHIPRPNPETTRRIKTYINYKMTMPYILPDIKVFYEMLEQTAPPGDQSVVDVEESRCYHHYESYYSEEPMSQMDGDDPPSEVYDAKDIENTLSRTDGSNEEKLDDSSNVENPKDGEKNCDDNSQCDKETPGDNNANRDTSDNANRNCDRSENHDSICDASETCQSDSSCRRCKCSRSTHQRHDASSSRSTDRACQCRRSARDDEDEAGLAGELAGLKLEGPPPQPMPQMNEREWQYAWERGQIDYLGIDSFSNIQGKIDDVLNNKSHSPEREEGGAKKKTSSKSKSSKPSKHGKVKS